MNKSFRLHYISYVIWHIFSWTLSPLLSFNLQICSKCPLNSFWCGLGLNDNNCVLNDVGGKKFLYNTAVYFVNSDIFRYSFLILYFCWKRQVMLQQIWVVLALGGFQGNLLFVPFSGVFNIWEWECGTNPLKDLCAWAFLWMAGSLCKVIFQTFFLAT